MSANSTWTALSVTVPAEMADAVGSFLLDRGAPGLETEDLDGRIRVTAYFAAEPPLAEIEAHCRWLAAELPGGKMPEVRVGVVAEEAWEENWKEHFPPLTIGARLFVHPPWVTEVPAGRVGIVIDPGMAFGTGHHASTRGCLALLEKYVTRARAPRVLDVGIGSGILAIAAAGLGAAQVVGVDVDPEACRVARDNAAANGMAEKIVIARSLDVLEPPFDVIVANLLARPLVELSERFYELLGPGCVVIGSGMLAEEAGAVARAWQRAGMRALERHDEEGWTTLAHARATASA